MKWHPCVKGRVLWGLQGSIPERRGWTLESLVRKNLAMPGIWHQIEIPLGMAIMHHVASELNLEHVPYSGFLIKHAWDGTSAMWCIWTSATQMGATDRICTLWICIGSALAMSAFGNNHWLKDLSLSYMFSLCLSSW